MNIKPDSDSEIKREDPRSDISFWVSLLQDPFMASLIQSTAAPSHEYCTMMKRHRCAVATDIILNVDEGQRSYAAEVDGG
jgi:hypothetical protein